MSGVHLALVTLLEPIRKVDSYCPTIRKPVTLVPFRIGLVVFSVGICALLVYGVPKISFWYMENRTMNSTGYTNWLDTINPYHYYPNPYFWGVLLFFLVPTILWLIGVLFIKRPKLSDKLVAFIAGSDNRLSLSRLQAFAWTLVIFGSWVAGMAVHTKISPLGETATIQAKADAQFYADIRDFQKGVYDKALATFQQTGDRTAIDKAKVEYYTAMQDANTASAKASSSDWVRIPGALLALAGIAVASGIFSSLISAVNSEDKSACVTGIARIDPPEFNDPVKYPETVDSQSINLLKIVGRDMGKVGKVRFGKNKVYSVLAPILYWRDDGTEIIVDVPTGEHPYTTIVVDTANGKIAYEIADTSADSGPVDMKLGVGTYWYEFSDLFRDDKNPMNMDLMKFQMFGWTVVAICVYAWVFLNDLSNSISTLPLVPDSIVILTGLSQLGYLAGKGVSNVPANTK